ncbi:MAG TPA: hypothetical protein V6D19_09445 [Stenomitos sp.]
MRRKGSNVMRWRSPKEKGSAVIALEVALTFVTLGISLQRSQRLTP